MGAAAGPDIAEDGLVLHLDAANERSYPGSGNTWYDLSGNGNDASLINGVGYSKSNKGIISVDGTDDYIFSSLDIINDREFSMFFIIKRSSLEINGGSFFSAVRGPGSRDLINFGNNSSSYRILFRYYNWSGNDPEYKAPGKTLSVYLSNKEIYSYIFVGITCKNKIFKFYLNEELVDQDTITIPLDIPNVRLGTSAGQGGNAWGKWKGKIPFCSFYKRELKKSEVNQIYYAIKGRYDTLGSYNKPALKAIDILQLHPDSDNDVYWIDTGFGPTPVFCDMENGGWMLVSSNNARDSFIPGGTSRNNSSYQLDRNGITDHLGIPSPDRDYIIGQTIRNLDFNSVKIWGFGRGSLDNTKSWNGDQGNNIIVEWNLSSTGDARFDEIVPLSNVTSYGNTQLHSRADYFILDSVYKDISLNANSNQSTVGASGVYRSNGDPSNGTFLGHGSTEGSYEGWYIYGSSPADSQGYTTWVK